MTKIQKIFLLLFVLFLAAIPAWLYLAVPELLKIPRDYQFNVELLSTEQTRYDIGKPLSDIAILKGYIKLDTTELNSESIDIEGLFHIEYLDGTLSYESPEKYTVNRVTHLVQMGDRKAYFMFPQKLDKQEMTIYFPGWSAPFDLRFEGEETIDGLLVYKYISDIENYNITQSFSFLDSIPEIYNASVDNRGEYWVEPISGRLVKYSESGIDYYTEKETGVKVQDFSQYSNKFSNDTIANQVRIAQNEKQKIILYERWIPILLGLISLAFLIALFASRKVALKREQPVISTKS
jgi:hypothetical protein